MGWDEPTGTWEMDYSQVPVPDNLLPPSTDDLCLNAGCGREVHADGWCMNHYRKIISSSVKRGERVPGRCRIRDCPDPEEIGGLCELHLERMIVFGSLVRGGPRTTCTGPECGREVVAKGFCGTHYAQWWHGRELTPIGSALRGGGGGSSRGRGSGRGARRDWGAPCKVPDCERPYFISDYCKGHYYRWHHHGDPSLGGELEPQDECAVAECGFEVLGNGLCPYHYHRNRMGRPIAPSRDAVDGDRQEGKAR